jgi:hypothetical protein
MKSPVTSLSIRSHNSNTQTRALFVTSPSCMQMLHTNVCIGLLYEIFTSVDTDVGGNGWYVVLPSQFEVWPSNRE